MGRKKGSLNKPKSSIVAQPRVLDEKPVNKELYSVSLLANGKEYKATGPTLKDAVHGLKPEFYKTKGILRITKGNKKIERFLFPLQMRKLFNNTGSLTAEIALMTMTKFLDKMLG